MHTVDRQGIHIDQCHGCRGIFLDRGELESILRAERRYADAAPPPYQPELAHDRRHHPDEPWGHGGHRRKRRSFLEELFD